MSKEWSNVMKSTVSIVADSPMEHLEIQGVYRNKASYKLTAGETINRSQRLANRLHEVAVQRTYLSWK